MVKTFEIRGIKVSIMVSDTQKKSPVFGLKTVIWACSGTGGDLIL